MSKNPTFKSNDDGDEEDDDDDGDDDDVDDHDDGDDDETPGIAYGESSLWGGGGGVPFSWSFKDKGSSPPLCFAK